MKLRLTPLNIITALSFALLVVSFFQTKTAGQHFDMTAFYKFLLGCLVVVSFVSDLIFRFTFKDLKRIWIVELVFIALTAILILILQK
ncbi:hypothetical protein [Pedobacter boryungensis]|uniref:hypothetical protein n=1 Tax=Pedobacter boryungensis TaxID=869962 RepID=UPI001C208FC1|nr:hypothetical protein [Pedobacter boryungensis]